MTSLTTDLYEGAVGTFQGLNLSDNKPVEVTGEIIAIRDAAWALVTIQLKDGSIQRIRIV